MCTYRGRGFGKGGERRRPSSTSAWSSSGADSVSSFASVGSVDSVDSVGSACGVPLDAGALTALEDAFRTQFSSL